VATSAKWFLRPPRGDCARSSESRSTSRAIIPPITESSRPRASPIDIIFLVERLESLIANGKKLPLTSNVVVDQNEALRLVDELRAAVPEEVRAAKRINSEGERIIEKAQEEADRIVARAQEQATFLIDERGLTEAADRESEKIVARAHRESDEVRRGADEYAASVLTGLEAEVARTLQSIKKGIVLLDERRADLRQDGAEQDGHGGLRNGTRNGNAADAEDEVEGASQPARL
jgi:cell division septum initiation protein DivIVA